MRYLVTIAGKTVEVDVDGDAVVIDGTPHPAELRPLPGTPVQNLLVDGSSWVVPMESQGGGRWLIQRWGERFEVEVIDERTRHIRSLIGEGKPPSGPAALRAPMPGLVVRVLVQPGQVVAAGQGLVVLEAMKMENELKATGPAVVDQVSAEPGKAVEKGAVLVTFRSDA